MGGIQGTEPMKLKNFRYYYIEIQANFEVKVFLWFNFPVIHNLTEIMI